jgi:16S rRNA (cytosine967-C5)-methyltransferase
MNASLNSFSKSNPDGMATKTKNRVKPQKTDPSARFVAISVLADASAAGTFATRELEESPYFRLLDSRDRAFTRLLVATVERRIGQIDNILEFCIEKPNKGKHVHFIRATLRTGVAQLLFLHTPPFAAIKETVQVLRMYPKNPPIPEPIIKFVNGVLRKLSRQADDESEGSSEMFGEKLLREKTSPQDNISPWLLNQWCNDWGEERTDFICSEVMPSDNISMTARIDLSTKFSLAAATGMNDYKEEMQSLMESLGEDSILLPQFSIRVGSSLKGDVKLWPGYGEGAWWVQDSSSTLPALVLSSAIRDIYPQSDLSELHVVDMCSAPGGKASQLLSVGFGRVTAIEANPRRSRRLTENLKRLDLLEKCEIVVDEGQNWVPSSVVHGILVDVPCSATGTGARRPDVLRRDPDLKELVKIQQVLANHCADTILDKGGIMVYATCSLLREESEDQVRKLIERGNVETLPIQPHEVPGFEDAIDEQGWLRVLPGILEGDLRSTDGFFVARLVRK